MSDGTWATALLAALNVIQTVALAYIAAKYRASNGNGQSGPRA